MLGTITRTTYVLLVLLDRHRHLGHRPAHPVREVLTPPQLGVPAKCVITILFRTQLEQLHARCVPQGWDLSRNPEGRIAKPVRQGVT
jgi:hypothetical protein